MTAVKLQTSLLLAVIKYVVAQIFILGVVVYITQFTILFVLLFFHKDSLFYEQNQKVNE